MLEFLPELKQKFAKAEHLHRSTEFLDDVIYQLEICKKLQKVVD